MSQEKSGNTVKLPPKPVVIRSPGQNCGKCQAWTPSHYATNATYGDCEVLLTSTRKNQGRYCDSFKEKYVTEKKYIPAPGIQAGIGSVPVALDVIQRFQGKPMPTNELVYYKTSDDAYVIFAKASKIMITCALAIKSGYLIEAPGEPNTYTPVGGSKQSLKENTVSNMSVKNVLIRLADSQLNQDVAKFGGLPLDITEALKEAQAEQRKAVAKEAAQEIVTLYSRLEARISSGVDDIRRLRAQANSEVHNLQNLSKARAYGEATGNFLPLAKFLGVINSFDADAKLLEIDESKLPVGWDKRDARSAEAQPETSSESKSE
jgi:hypothetical protein